MIARFGALLVILVALAGADVAVAETSPPANPPERASLPEIEDEVMCPVCGTLLGLSHAPAAERQRVFIRKLIKQGKTKDEIKDALVAEYGGQVLALPENRGIDVWAYLVPAVGLILGGLAVILAIFVWRRRRPEDDDDPSESAPSEEASARVDQDMARFDL